MDQSKDVTQQLIEAQADAYRLLRMNQELNGALQALVQVSGKASVQELYEHLAKAQQETSVEAEVEAA